MKYVLSIALLFSTFSLLAQEENPILGNWTLNYEQSNFLGARPQFDVRQYRMREDGFLVGLAIWVDSEGNPGFLQFTAKSDGNFYPEHDSSTLADLQAANTNSGRTYSETIIDVNTIAWTDKNQGIVTASGEKTFTNDGEKMAILVNFENQEGEMLSYTLVYDKQ